MPEPTLRLFDGYDHTSPELRDAVRQLQSLLSGRGLVVSVDGYFGRETEAAVDRFQREHGLEPDGIVGPLTWASLHGDVAPEPGTAVETTYAPDDAAMLRQLPLVERYREAVERGAARADVPPAVICGIGSRESLWGLALTPPGPAGTGDTIRRASRKPWRDGDLPPDGGGFGRGLMQIDFDAHEFARTGTWRDPEANIAYGCEVLLQNFALLRRRTALADHALLRAAVAAYNCGGGNVLTALAQGRDVDYFTHGRNYSRDVLDRAGWFRLQGW